MSGAVVFEVGREKYQLPRSDVFRILRVWESCRQAPVAAGGAESIIVYRGRPVKVVDVGRYAGMPPTARGPDTRIILLRRGTDLVGLLVDRVVGPPPDVPRSRRGVG